MKKSQNTNSQQQSIQESHHSQIQSDSQSQSISSIDSQDEIKQKPVFEILDEQRLIQFKQHKQADQNRMQEGENQQHLPDQGLYEDERQAFLYLLSVRKEKKSLLEEKRKRKSQQKRKFSKINIEIKQENVVISPSENQCKQNQNQDSLQNSIQYSECIVKNFHIVVENVKYLIKTNPIYSHNNKKFNNKLYESIKLQNQPLVYQLTKLTIGEIQDAIRKLSLQLHLGPKTKYQNHNNNTQLSSKSILNQQKPQEKQQKQPQKPLKSSLISYNLWIYSLLALHQAWSSYKHFETLAEINFVLTQNITKIDKLSIKQKQSLLILFILITKVFQQRHMEKFSPQILFTANDREIKKEDLCKIE